MFKYKTWVKKLFVKKNKILKKKINIFYKSTQTSLSTVSLSTHFNKYIFQKS